MKAYKLFRLLSNGSLAPLFINKSQRIPIGVWLKAENHPTKGYAECQGWHCTLQPIAPHLSTKGRVWCEVEIENYQYYNRPESQGGMWVLAQEMKVVERLGRVDDVVWQIDTQEWYYKGLFIQEQSHPSLSKYIVFEDTDEQFTIATCSTFSEAKAMCKANRVENPLHSPLEYL